MKLRILILALLVICLLSATVFASKEDTYLFDVAGVLSPEEESTLNQELALISKNLDINVMAAIVSGEIAYPTSEANSFFYAKSSKSDGVFLYLVVNEGRTTPYLRAHGDTLSQLTEAKQDKIEKSCYSLLRSGNYTQGISAYANSCHKQLASLGSLRLTGKHVLLSIVIGMVLSFLVPMTMLKNQLKSVRSQPEANGYIKQNSLSFSRQTDTFLYRNVTRIPKPKKKTHR